MAENAMAETFDLVELFGSPALFTTCRIDADTIPEGWHRYEIRGSDNDPEALKTLEFSVSVNHSGTILIPEEIDIPSNPGYVDIDEELDFLVEELTLAEFCEQYGLPAP